MFGKHMLTLRKLFGVLLLVTCALIMRLEYYSFWIPIETIGNIQPPKPSLNAIGILNAISWDKLSSTIDKFTALETLSSIVQLQLKELQQVPEEDCDKVTTLKCGHIQDCGFACQVHHRVACLMTSYALNMPLIHDENTGWSYKTKWSQIFRELGSRCKPSPNTFTLEWLEVGRLPLIYRKNCAVFCRTKTIYHPLDGGIPVPRELGELVELVHSHPWLWWIGQFMKYGLTLRPEQKKAVDSDKTDIEFSKSNSPIVGIQVRRTDKIIESQDSVHPLQQYFQESDIFFEKMAGKSGSINKTVFVASDDHLVLQEATKKFQLPEWNVLRFPNTVTLGSMSERTEDLYSIVRDLVILSECDYVICGFSSNICRLLLEMFSYRVMDPLQRVKSLDGEYSYLYKSKIIPQRVLKY